MAQDVVLGWLPRIANVHFRGRRTQDCILGDFQPSLRDWSCLFCTQDFYQDVNLHWLPNRDVLFSGRRTQDCILGDIRSLPAADF